jgi:hypothetical protein
VLPPWRNGGRIVGGLETPFLSSFQAPRQLSGGERQRGGLDRLAGAKPPQFSPEAEKRPTYSWRAEGRRRRDGSLAGAPAWRGRHGAELRERRICAGPAAQREAVGAGVRWAEGRKRSMERRRWIASGPHSRDSVAVRWRHSLLRRQPRQEGVAETWVSAEMGASETFLAPTREEASSLREAAGCRQGGTHGQPSVPHQSAATRP